MRGNQINHSNKTDSPENTTISIQCFNKKCGIALIIVLFLLTAILCITYYKDILISLHYIHVKYFTVGKPTFTYCVWLEDADSITHHNTIMKVYYNGIVVEEMQSGNGPIHIGFTNDTNGTDRCLYMIRGWVDNPTEIRMETYLRDPDTGELLEMIQTQTILVKPGLVSYDIKLIN